MNCVCYRLETKKILNMTDFEILRQEIQSWYPDYQFTDNELNDATRDLIKFFAEGALSVYKQKSKK